MSDRGACNTGKAALSTLLCRLGRHKPLRKFGGWIICRRCGTKLGQWYG